MALEGLVLVFAVGCSVISRAIKGVNMSPGVAALLLIPEGGATVDIESRQL